MNDKVEVFYLEETPTLVQEPLAFSEEEPRQLDQLPQQTQQDPSKNETTLKKLEEVMNIIELAHQ